MTRMEHVLKSKSRALGYLEDGYPELAVASFIGDLYKHDQTKADADRVLAEAQRSAMDKVRARKFVEGFN